MSKKNLILALLAVSAIGLLFGTDKGAKLRKKLKKKGMDTVDNLKSKMNKYADRYADAKV